MPCSALTRIIGESISSKNWVSQQNEESGWDIADTLLRLLHRDWSGWEERNKRDSRYAAFYAVVCSWGLIWQATGLGRCFLDLHKYHCEYLTGQICGRTVPTSSLHGHSMLSSFLDSLGQVTAADLSLACLVPSLSRVTFQAWHGPHLTLLSQQHGLLSSLSTESLCLACRVTGWEVVSLQVKTVLNGSWCVRKFKMIQKQW